jgi:hypothetical protein
VALPSWTQPYFWFDLVLTFVLAAADAGSIVAIDRIGDAYWSEGAGRRSAAVYAALIAPTWAVLGWFDALPTFFLLGSLAYVVAPVRASEKSRSKDSTNQSGLEPKRWIMAGTIAGIGAMVKLFPLIVLPAMVVAAATGQKPSNGRVLPTSRLTQPDVTRLGFAIASAALAIAILAVPFLLTAPATFLATFRNVLARGSWESPWALLDGHYGSGVVASLSDRLYFNDSASWGQPSRFPIIWWLVVIVCGAFYVSRFRIALRVRTPRAAVAVTALAMALLMLLSTGFSVQFIVWIVPFVVLLMPGIDGAILLVLLTLDSLVLEGYLYITLFPTLHRLLWISIAIRTALLIWFALECAFAIEPGGWRRYFEVRRRITRPIGVVSIFTGVITASVVGPSLLDAMQDKFGNPPVANALAAAPGQATLIFTQASVYDRFASATGDRPSVVVAEPHLTTWTGEHSLYRRLSEALAGAGDVVVVTDTSLGPNPLLDPVNRVISASYGSPVSQDIETIRLASYASARRPDPRPLDVTFGDAIRLVGVIPDLSSARAGSTLSLTLVWTTASKIRVDYSVSTQLLDGSGRLIAQHDSMPVDNMMPMSAWEPGETIHDPVSLTMPGSAPTGAYSLIVVVYDHQSLARLSPRGTGSQGDHAVVASVKISS